MSCGNPGDIHNGRKFGTTYSFKSSVQYVCDTGYTLQGSWNRTCQANKRWSGIRPTCKGISCYDSCLWPNILESNLFIGRMKSHVPSDGIMLMILLNKLDQPYSTWERWGLESDSAGPQVVFFVTSVIDRAEPLNFATLPEIP